MKTNIIRRVFGLVLAMGVSTASALMCYPPNEDKGVVYNDAQQPRWYVWEYNSIADTQAMTTGMNGNHAIKVTYTQNWGEFILFRSSVNGGEQLWHTGNYRALVFRVKGIHNNCEKQLWMHLREESGVTYEPVPITKYMVSPESTVHQDCWGYPNEPVGQYDPNKWYTVVIPPNAFLNYSPITQPDLIIKDVIFEGGHLADYAAGETATVYLDDIWWVEGLKFPLDGYAADTVPITSVFDHTMTDGSGDIEPLGIDGVVTAYTGEVSNGAVSSHDSTCVGGADAPYNDLMSNYVGAGECHPDTGERLHYLSYDGHPAYDYAWSGILGTPIHAPAAGEVVLSDCPSHPGVVNWPEVAQYGSECLGSGTGYGKLIIDHDGPYMSSINHALYVRPGLGVGTRVQAGDIVAYVGNTHKEDGQSTLTSPHLHIGFLLDEGDALYIPHRGKTMGTYVDPYGWSGLYTDPYRTEAVSVPLWK